MTDKIFVTYKKFQHFCPTKYFANEKFCPFSKFEISSKKAQFIYFFRDLPFLYHKNNKNEVYPTFQQLCSTRSHCPQSRASFFLLSA